VEHVTARQPTTKRRKDWYFRGIMVMLQQSRCV
jgi:hypothetical protein